MSTAVSTTMLDEKRSCEAAAPARLAHSVSLSRSLRSTVALDGRVRTSAPNPASVVSNAVSACRTCSVYDDIETLLTPAVAVGPRGQRPAPGLPTRPTG